MGPTARYSLTASPMPRPTVAALSDKIRMKTIQDRPDLFKINCQINVDRFEKLLTHHLNRPFVDSVLVGLREGFWPFADTTKEGYPKTWDASS